MSDTSTTVKMFNPWEELDTTTDMELDYKQSQFPELDINFDESVVPPKERGVLYFSIITIYILVMFMSFIFNIYFLVILIYLRKALSDRPFFRIVWQLVIANILSVIANVGTSFPIIFYFTVSETAVYLKSNKHSFFAAIDETGDQIVLFCVLLIAVYRLLVFTIPERLENFFSRYILNLFLFLIWLIAVGSSMVFYVYHCSFKFDPETKYTFEYHCTNTDTPKKLYYTIGKVLQFQLLLIPILCLLFYSIIIVIIILQKKEMMLRSMDKRLEKDILMQAVFIFVAFEINSLALYLSMNVPTQTMAFYIRKIVNTIEFLSGMLTPLFFLLTSREIKKADEKLNPIRKCYRKCFVRERSR